MARGLGIPSTLVLSALVVAAFALASALTLPVGVLTSASPTVMPLYLVQPIPLAMLLGRSCLSPAAALEATAPRPARATHAALLAAVMALTLAMLAANPALSRDTYALVTASYVGSVGLLLIGVALLGRLGVLLPAAYLCLLTVLGTSDDGQPAPWAWTLQPTPTALTTGATLLVLGSVALAARWRRTIRHKE
ncbi:hypothetical protein [Terrabacter sp. NPDC080008]|uniref:hypothetical protein n=1 Tax=Terrabacter sp. NPDC080008 TaxID=3155176 RepID=UPI00344C7093